MKFGKFKPCNEYHLEGTEHYEFRFKNGYGGQRHPRPLQLRRTR